MPVDGSVYGMFKPADFGEAIERGYRLKEADVRMSDLARQRAKDQRLEGMQSESHAATMRNQNLEFQNKQLEIVGPEMERLAGLPEEQRAVEYPLSRQRLLKQGIIKADDSPEEYDPGYFRQSFNQYKQSPSYLARKKTEAETAHQLALAKRGPQADPMAAFLAKEGYKERRDAALKEEELKTNYGIARTSDDAKKLKDAGELKENFDRKLTEMIDLRKEFGGEMLNREAVGRGKQLSSDLLLLYKDMAKLGVLSVSDEKILNSIIPKDPLEFNWSGAAGQDPTMHKLSKFRDDANADFETRVANRVRGGNSGDTRTAGGSTKDVNAGGGNLIKDAKAGKQWDSVETNPKYFEAMKFIKANPNDPRAKQMLEKLKGGT